MCALGTEPRSSAGTTNELNHSAISLSPHSLPYRPCTQKQSKTRLFHCPTSRLCSNTCLNQGVARAGKFYPLLKAGKGLPGALFQEGCVYNPNQVESRLLQSSLCLPASRVHHKLLQELLFVFMSLASLQLSIFAALISLKCF